MTHSEDLWDYEINLVEISIRILKVQNFMALISLNHFLIFSRFLCWSYE